MPNCDFYATEHDHEQVLDWLFAEGSCRVFELYSQSETPLQEFHSPSEVLAQFERVYRGGTPWHTVYLQLYVIGAGPPFAPTRIRLDPEKCDGATFRYRANGLGLIQLYLAKATPEGLQASHTNHHSAAGARASAGLVEVSDTVEGWDFKKITAFSSRLNRYIRKLGVAKLESRAVLPGALALWNERVPLRPYTHEESELRLNPPRGRGLAA